MSKKIFFYPVLLSLAACSLPSKEYLSYDKVSIGKQFFSYSVYKNKGYNRTWVKTQPLGNGDGGSGLWIDKFEGGKEKISDRKKALKELALKELANHCKDYEIINETYDMSRNTNTNEFITSMITLTEEAINPSYDVFPLDYSLELQCKN